MNRYSFIFFLVLFFTGISAGIGQAPSREKIQTRILFVGNSYTYFNNLPQILQQIAFAGGNGNVEVQMVAEGGATLRDIWEKGAALKVIREHSWNYVILQDQSSLGNTYIVNGKERIVDQSEFLRYARLFDAEIKKKGAKTVFYLTWAKEDADAREQMALNNAYVSIARDLRDLVAPVGVVWQRVRRQFPKLALYISDKSHPTAAGSYLAAIVLYTTIFRKSPVGLPAELKGNPVDEDGKIDLTKTVSLVDIPAKEARLIQVAAWRTYVQQSRAGGYFSAPKPSRPKLPALATGHRPRLDELEGIWQGPLNFYPVPWPATLTLSIHRQKDGWQTKLQIDFEGSLTNRKTPEITDFKITDFGISFVDPKGIGGAPVRYKAAFEGKLLDGIMKVNGKNIFAVGKWKLTRLR